MTIGGFFAFSAPQTAVATFPFLNLAIHHLCRSYWPLQAQAFQPDWVGYFGASRAVVVVSLCRALCAGYGVAVSDTASPLVVSAEPVFLHQAR
jgi:hypothetical protein